MQNITKSISRLFTNSAGVRPRRSLLYVPGTDDRKVIKATGLSADVVVLDCEDGVALTMKKACRENIQKLLPTLDFGASESVIRINSIDSEFASDDIEAALTSDCITDALMIPKIENVDQIKWFKEQCHRLIQNGRHKSKQVNVIGQTETPLGLMNLRDIMKEVVKDDTCLNFQSFVFGSDDYLASIGAARTKDATELLFARQYFIMHVKGYGLQAIDMVDINFKDLDGLQKQSIEGAKMGFTGKQVIHPAQIDIVNESFSPSKQQIEYAKELIEAYDQHQLTGKGAFTFNNSMIDMPLVKQARNVISVGRS